MLRYVVAAAASTAAALTPAAAQDPRDPVFREGPGHLEIKAAAPAAAVRADKDGRVVLTCGVAP